jgi:acetyl esterase/lipase
MNIHQLEQPFPIWPREAPPPQNSISTEQQTPLLWNSRIVRNVTEPSLIPYWPNEQNGTAIIICPGGAFQFLMIDKEGTEVANWLTSYGITAFILKYRLAPTAIDDAKFVSNFESSNFDLSKIGAHIETSYTDGIQAVATLKRKALDFKIDRSRVGMIGFSAGAAIAVHSVFNTEIANCPDFIGAIYGGPPEITNIPSHAPPLFMAYANDDGLAGNTCLDLFQAWKRSKRSVEVHAYSKGGHGFGLIKQGLPCDNWADSFISWLKNEGFIPMNE